MCLFFVYLSMTYRVYSRSRVHMSIVSGIQRESGVFDNPIRSDCDRYIRVWTKSCFRFPLLSPPIFPGCRFDWAAWCGDRTICLTGGGTERKKKTERKDGTPTGELDDTGTPSSPFCVSRDGEEGVCNVDCLPAIQVAFLCSFCDLRIYQSHCLYNRRYGKRLLTHF